MTNWPPAVPQAASPQKSKISAGNSGSTTSSDSTCHRDCELARMTVIPAKVNITEAALSGMQWSG